jgi:hypothetical protein
MAKLLFVKWFSEFNFTERQILTLEIAPRCAAAVRTMVFFKETPPW